MASLLVSSISNNLHIRIKRVAAALLVGAGTGTAALGCYAFVIKSQVGSLLKDVAALVVGSSTESDVEQVTKKHGWYLVSHESSDEVVTRTFKAPNRWLSLLRLEPLALFGASVGVREGRVYHTSAWLMRSMDIYPTFEGSAGMVDEYVEYPQYLSHRGHVPNAHRQSLLEGSSGFSCLAGSAASCFRLFIQRPNKARGRM